MTKQEKNKFCLRIAEKAKEFITNKEAKNLIEYAIEKCRKWLNSECDISEWLYNCLDNEENGFTLFQENEADEKIKVVWDCIIDAFAFICRSAYVEAGAKYLPEPIELVDNNTISHMLTSFLSVSKSDLEISIRGEKVLRLWTAEGCAEMNDAYHIQKYLPNAWAVGDDEGGFAIICVKNETEPGMYAVSFSDLDNNEKIFIAHSITEFLFDGVGVDDFLNL